ncbi:tetratricopeptide repeat protein [Fulvivirga sediminis]|uniref:Tetratricopeptide repeat protein n=1 Tax=Fulvivirga sediminis TaxID=2803949 RepID=A0A937K109_9BACT|nr:tetratricopeptide repeat protein [Fulvivirga sediminis]MBL3658883.1 tetratricopeptide repeat protein [Fulvivirga sediminis]
MSRNLAIILLLVFSCGICLQSSAADFSLVEKACCSFSNGEIKELEYYENHRDYLILDIDVNKDGILDKVVNNKNGDELLFFVKRGGEYENVYHGENYSFDGVYFVDTISAFSVGNNICCIKTFFNGAGGQNINYFIAFDNGEWKVNKSIAYNLSHEANRICITADKEDCIDLGSLENATLLSRLKVLLKEKHYVKNLSEEFIFTLLSNYPLKKETIGYYNDIAYYMEQLGAYDESVYLLNNIIDKYPERTVAYINLGDAYWGFGKKEEAREAYHIYVQKMKEAGKESKIPKVINERLR